MGCLLPAVSFVTALAPLGLEPATFQITSLSPVERTYSLWKQIFMVKLVVFNAKVSEPPPGTVHIGGCRRWYLWWGAIKWPFRKKWTTKLSHNIWWIGRDWSEVVTQTALCVEELSLMLAFQLQVALHLSWHFQLNKLVRTGLIFCLKWSAV